MHNKREKSKAVLTKWHGNGNSESPWVNLQVGEYEEFLNTNGAVRRRLLEVFMIVDHLTKYYRTNAGGTTAHSSAIAPPATALCATVCSLYSVNGLEMEL